MFQGFDDTTVDFMWGIRFNNDRTWFAQHKQEYLDHFQTPMRELQREVYDHIAPQLPDYGLIGKVSRIYRDARRLFGRGPYKDHLWLSVERPKEDGATPCFWFELGPEEWSYGLGFWRATPMTMAKLRARIARDPEPVRKLTEALMAQEEFVLSGQEYKRAKPGAPAEDLAVWFLRRSVAFSHSEPLTEELFSRDILERIKRGYDFLIPYYEYLVTVDSDPEPEEK